MNFWKFIAVFLCSFFAQPIFGQIDTLKIIKLRDRNSFMTTDHLGALYVVERNDIQKYAQPLTSNRRIHFSEPRFGDIAHIDAFNPLGLVVFFKPFNQIIIIDNQLNPTRDRIEPEPLGIMDPQLISATEQKMLWMYDQASDRLFRYNMESQRVEFQSQIITKLAGQEVEPVYLVSDMNGVYLSCPEVGILIFDFFGNYRKRIPEKDVQRFQVKNRSIIFHRNGILEFHEIDKPESQQINLPIENIRNIRMEDRVLFIQTKKEIIIGKISGETAR
jgi:hypothetical protein